jgi:3-oxoacyl-[acyl-carrier protein] reductase
VNDLSGRVAVITGGGRGIGRVISLRLAGAGAAVAIGYRRDEAAANETWAEIVAAGGQATVYRASVEEPEQVLVMTEQVLSDFGGVDIVVISSTATQRAVAGGGPYMMAKAALEAFAATLAAEEMRHGIHVNVVAPGLVATEMGDRLARAITGVSRAAELDAGSPYGRVCRPEDVADGGFPGVRRGVVRQRPADRRRRRRLQLPRQPPLTMSPTHEVRNLRVR